MTEATTETMNVMKNGITDHTGERSFIVCLLVCCLDKRFSKHNIFQTFFPPTDAVHHLPITAGVTAHGPAPGLTLLVCYSHTELLIGFNWCGCHQSDHVCLSQVTIESTGPDGKLRLLPGWLCFCFFIVWWVNVQRQIMLPLDTWAVLHHCATGLFISSNFPHIQNLRIFLFPMWSIIKI